jgi:hypothetical protein
MHIQLWSLQRTASKLHSPDHADQCVWVGIEQFQGFERFDAETGQAANLALWELQGTVTVQVEAEHFRIAAVALFPVAERVHRCLVSVEDTVMTCAARWNEMSLT